MHSIGSIWIRRDTERSSNDNWQETTEVIWDTASPLPLYPSKVLNDICEMEPGLTRRRSGQLTTSLLPTPSLLVLTLALKAGDVAHDASPACSYLQTPKLLKLFWPALSLEEPVQFILLCLAFCRVKLFPCHRGMHVFFAVGGDGLQLRSTCEYTKKTICQYPVRAEGGTASDILCHKETMCCEIIQGPGCAVLKRVKKNWNSIKAETYTDYVKGY